MGPIYWPGVKELIVGACIALVCGGIIGVVLWEGAWWLYRNVTIEVRR